MAKRNWCFYLTDLGLLSTACCVWLTKKSKWFGFTRHREFGGIIHFLRDAESWAALSHKLNCYYSSQPAVWDLTEEGLQNLNFPFNSLGSITYSYDISCHIAPCGWSVVSPRPLTQWLLGYVHKPTHDPWWIKRYEKWMDYFENTAYLLGKIHIYKQDESKFWEFKKH